MQKMTRSPAMPGPTGPPWFRSRARVTYARRRSRATTAAAVELAGQKMSEKFNTRFTKLKLIHKYHDQWCRDNGYPVYKPSSKATQEAKPQAKGSSLKPESTS